MAWLWKRKPTPEKVVSGIADLLRLAEKEEFSATLAANELLSARDAADRQRSGEKVRKHRAQAARHRAEAHRLSSLSA